MYRFKEMFLIFVLFATSLYAKELEKVTLQLQWLHQFQFAGYYIAKEKGYYEEAGLDVEIRPYNGKTNIVNEVSNHSINYATGRTSLIIDKNEGKDVIALAAIFQQSPSILLVTNLNKIKTIKDIKHKRVMITNDEISSASYMAMLLNQGLRQDDIKKQKHSFNLDDLINNKTDVMASYISNEPFILEQKNIPYKYFHPKDYGFNFYGDILFTSSKELKNHPLRVKAFREASLKGWEYAFKHIEETARLIKEKYNTQNKSIKALVYEGYTLKKLAYVENTMLGHIDEKMYTEIANIYKLMGLIRSNYSLKDFIYENNLDKHLFLTKDESAWLLNNRELRLGSNKEWNPIEFVDDKQQLKGISSGYIELLKRKLNISFTIHNKNYWHRMMEKMRNKKVDIFTAVVKTPQRERFMNFTKPYLSFPTVIVTKDDIGYIKSLKELNNKIVAVERNFYTDDLLSLNYPDIKLLRSNTTKDALQKVFEGEAYAYVGALPNIGYFIKALKYTNLKINGETEFPAEISIGTRKDLPLLTSIMEKTLDILTEDEKDQIYNRWINVTYKYESELDYRLIATIIIFTLLVSVLFYMRNRALQKEVRLRNEFNEKLKSLNKELEFKNESLKALSEIDTLTQIPNRRKIYATLRSEMERTQRNGIPFSIIMFDIDHFKNINDLYGHEVGDKVLFKIAQLVKNNVRSIDLVGRLGGEEFIIICPNSNLEQSYILCEKIQNILQVNELAEELIENCTVSFGISQYRGKKSENELLKEADDQLYSAKDSGRNTIRPIITFN